MTRIAWFEIDGWGQASTWSAPATVTGVNGAEFEVFTTQVLENLAGSSPGQEIGAVWAYRKDASDYGAQFRAEMIEAPGGDVYRFRLLRPDMVSLGESDEIELRLDDTFKVASDIPEGLGDAAAARWIVALDDIPRQQTQELPDIGGVASAPSGPVQVLYDEDSDPRLRMLGKAVISPYRQELSPEETPRAAVVNANVDAEDTVLPVRDPPSIIAGEVISMGIESMYVEKIGDELGTVSGIPVFEAEVVRGVLRTLPTQHPRLSAVHPGLQSPVGQLLRVFTGESQGRYADARQRFLGLVESGAAVDDQAALALQCSGVLSLAYTRTWRGSGLTDRVYLATSTDLSDPPLASSEVGNEAPAETLFAPGYPVDRPRLLASVYTDEILPQKNHRWAILGKSVAMRVLRPEESDTTEETETVTTPAGPRVRTRRYFAGAFPGLPPILPSLLQYANGTNLVVVGENDFIDDVVIPVTIEEPVETGIAFSAVDLLRSFGRGSLDEYDNPLGTATTFELRRRAIDRWRDAIGGEVEMGWVFDANTPGKSPLISPRETEAPEYDVRPVREHITSIILKVLCSTGTGLNSFRRLPGEEEYRIPGWPFDVNFDVLPRQFGLGVPVSEIDLRSFAQVWWEVGNSAYVYSAWIGEEDTSNPAEWLEELMAPYLLGLATGADGRLRLVDMSLVRSKEVIERAINNSIHADDLWTDDDEEPPRNARESGPPDMGGAVTMKAERFHLPTRVPDRRIEQRETSLTEFFGLSNPLSRMEPPGIELESEKGYPELDVFAQRYNPFLAPGIAVLPYITVELREDFELNVGDPAYFIDVPVYIGAEGTRVLSGLGQVRGIQLDVYTGLQTVDIRVSGLLDSGFIGAWSPCARVVGMDGSVVQVVENEFIPFDRFFQGLTGVELTFDSEGFREGDEVILVDRFHEYKSGPHEVLSRGPISVLLNEPVDGQEGDILVLATRPPQSQLTGRLFGFTDGRNVWR